MVKYLKVYLSFFNNRIEFFFFTEFLQYFTKQNEIDFIEI